jgi:hypothetical protein
MVSAEWIDPMPPRLAVCVTAPPMVQRARVLARPGMTPAKLDAILRRQMPDREKRRRASFVVPTGLGRLATWRALQQVIRMVRGCRGRHWPPGRSKRVCWRCGRSWLTPRRRVSIR